MTVVHLPELEQRTSPNASSRHGQRVDLLVLHETAGAYATSVDWLRNPISEVSAHLVLNERGDACAQLVPLDRKAWTQAAYNSRAVSLELATKKSQGFDSLHQLQVAARIFAWLSMTLRISARPVIAGVGAGLSRHLDLGAAGGGHTSCGPDDEHWRLFVSLVRAERARGGFRAHWAL